MSHDNEYHAAMVAVLELVWGKGYMAPGGPGSVEKMLRGIPTQDRHILDIGCGIGGPAIHMAKALEARVTGIDLEAPLLEMAHQNARAAGVAERITFRQVAIGPLDFPDDSFDIVLSAGALTQTEDKEAMLREIRRVLKPGGWVTLYDWLKPEGAYSADMLRWFELEGLTYAMRTFDEHAAALAAVGYQDIALEDASDWYRAEAHREYAALKGPLYDPMVALIGQSEADHFVENWHQLTIVCDKGEMLQGYLRGRA